MSDSRIVFNNTNINYDSLRFVLDASENSGRTIFASGEKAHMKLYPGGQNPEINITCGTISFALKNLKEEHTEYIVFRNSDTGKTSYPVQQIISAVWEGAGQGYPKVYGSRLILPDSSIGVLKVTYKTSYDLLEAVCPRSTYVLATAETNEMSGNFLIDFTGSTATEIYEKDVTLTIRDACTKEVLQNAYVYINGAFRGKSDTSGLVKLGSMKSGTYNLKITKEGYLDSDADTIKNDSFTVE